MKPFLRPLLLPLAAGTVGLAVGCEAPPMETEQLNYRGLGTEELSNPSIEAAKREATQIPEPLPPVEPGSPLASQVYQNVPVLGHVESAEFVRLMGAITEWVSPEGGCTYCHTGNLASDEIYTKVVSRRMLQMTRAINSEWKDHVGDTGVTCFTCHRGQPVPQNVWSLFEEPRAFQGTAGNRAGQNQPAPEVGLTSLPRDPFTAFLLESTPIRMQSDTALPAGNRSSIKETEWTYSFMIHMSDSLGVNCTYCHNSRAFMPWEESTPARETAWHGIRMAREINQEYIGPLEDVLPANRKGPAGDSLKVNCATCHQGVAKPLYGASLVDHYPALVGEASKGAPAPTPTTGPAPSPAPEEDVARATARGLD